MRNVKNYLLASLLIAGTACNSGNSGKDQESHTSKDSAAMKAEKEQRKDKMGKNVMKMNGLKVYPIQTKNFPNAQLKLDTPSKMNLKPRKTQFDFTVKNYKLMQATSDAAEHQLAESDNGQHIHFIRDNGPYKAKYTPSFEFEMEKGYHTVLAFLSRSYHESIKNKNAYVLKQFKVGEATGKKADLSKPQLFYSRPKGDYKGKDFERLLLDFYLVNVKSLSEDGYKVKAEINGTQFTFTEWKPYVIEGLEPGKLTVTLYLLNGQDELVDSKFNQVTREVTLKAGDSGSAAKKTGKSEKKSS